MKNYPFPQTSPWFSAPLVCLLLFALAPGLAGAAGTSTWTGGGGDSKWTTPANWNTPPSGTESLIFTGTTRLINTNTFTVGTIFNGISFSSPAGGFVLWGSSISLGGGITNSQVVTPQSINLPLSLTVTPVVNVSSNASLFIGGVVSGVGVGLTKVGGGTLTLIASNTFSGPLTVSGGTVVITNDANLGAAPAAFTAGNVVLSGGTVQTPIGLTIHSNRGILLGPVGGSGTGTFDVASGQTLIYRGVIANNTSATGSLAKLSFGSLTLSGTNTYTGSTAVKNGTLTLDFAQATSPANNIIKTNSSLIVGGTTAGIGTVNFASLVMLGRAGVTNAQGFNGTLIDIGGQVIRATNNGAGSAANLALGPITHNPGGVVTLMTPGLYGGGTIITATNSLVNGIIGGWATISAGLQSQSITYGTNLATVDAAGNVVNYTNYFVFAGSMLQGTVTGATNLLINAGSHPGGLAVAVTNDLHGANSTVDLNTVTFWNAVSGDSIIIGTNNTLRLGRFGGILKVENTTASYYIGGISGTQSGSGQAGAQGVGNLTAGGADNTPGEIVITANSSSGNSGGPFIEATIVNNGTGAVTVVKAGPSTMKIDGHNTYSGGTYITQGRLQLGGSDIGTANPDGFGVGPVFIFPGGQFFGGGSVSDVCSNDFLIAGNGTSSEAFGAIRTQDASIGSTDPARFAGNVTLIGDARLGGGSTNDPTELYGRITGAFNLEIGSTANTTARKNGYKLFNQANDWSGNFTILATAFGNGPINTRIVLGTNDVLPDGFGKGNIILQSGFASSTPILAQLDLNGFNETINGLFSAGIAETNSIIYNSVNGVTNTLTLGNNDQTAQFGGNILDAPSWFVPGGKVAVRKIGAGVQTLTSSNAFSGDTTIDAGTLALAGSGAVPNSLRVYVNSGATLDISGLTNGGFATTNTVALNAGIMAGNTATAGIGTLNLTNSQISITIHPATNNVFAGIVNTGGATNLININAVLGISAYPTQFTIIKYSTAFNGPTNFGFGSLPSLSTQGYFSNDLAAARILLVLTNGPKPLIWRGCTNGLWDINVTLNWLGFGAPSPFNTADVITFDDTACTNVVNMTTLVLPAGMTISNNSVNYAFIGAGAIGGFGGLLKQGASSATFLNIGGDGYRGGVTVSGGSVIFATDNTILGGVTVASGATLQVGTNGGTGSLPGGSVINDGSLIFNRGADLTVNNAIAGAPTGTLLKTGNGIVALNGANTFTGAVAVISGTLQTGNNSALGRTNGQTAVASGATLDVNGRSLGAEPVTAAGSGVGSSGAIVNSGSDTTTALRNVTLTNHTTFGGTGRWDIRRSTLPSDASLNTGGQAFNLTKVGPNQVSLVGAVVDGALANINVQQGTLSVELDSTLGNAANTLTVSAGATFQLFSNSVPADKVFVLNGTTTNVSFNNGAGVNSVSASSSVTLNGTNIINVGGVQLTFNCSIGGGGSLIKTGGNRLIFAGGTSISYSGSTTVSNGSLIVDGTKTSGTGLTVALGGSLGGSGFGGIAEPVVVNGGLAPGNPVGAGQGTLTINGNLTLNTSTNTFELSTSPFSGNDQVQVNGNLSLTGTNLMRIAVINYLSVGDTYTLFNYSGSPTLVDTNHIQIVPPFGYEFQLLDPVAATPGAVKILVTKALGFDQWTASVNGNWDVSTTANWLKNGLGSVFTNTDIANFLESPTPNTTNVNIVGTVEPSAIFFTNFGLPYQLSGTGRISGSGGMFLAGGQPVYIENSGGNDFTGPITIDGDNPDGGGLLPQLIIGNNNGATGDLGAGPMTNNASLVFWRSGALTLSNNIAGRGPITNLGTGVVTLSGNSSFIGDVFITNGTIRAGSGSALGSGSTNGASAVWGGATYVNSGATLDVNGNNLGFEQVVVSGAGVGAIGAIVNNNTNSQINALHFIMLAGDTTIGGIGRWDLRGDGVLLTDPPGSAYKITKVGTNQISLVAVTNIDPMLGDIDVQQGVFAVQTSTRQVGNPTNTITVHSTAQLNFFSLSGAPLNKNVVLLDGGAMWNENGASTNAGQITLQGSNTVNVSGTLTLNGPITGPGRFIKINTGTLYLFGTNTYAGNTVVSNGTMVLVGNTALTNSPVIDLAAANGSSVIDVTARTDGTLTLRSGQVLQGSGTVRGLLVAPAGSTVSPGHSIGLLVASNTVTLGGLAAMELDAASSTNDQVRTIANIVYGGTLNITNLNGTLAAGQSFRLFNATNYTGTFSSTTLPPLSSALLYWTNTLAIDGRIAVVARPQPKFNSIVALNGTDIVISGVSTNGVLTGNYYVLASTNVGLPVSTWTSIATNAFDGGGNFIFTNGINPVKPQLFYILQLP